MSKSHIIPIPLQQLVTWFMTPEGMESNMDMETKLEKDQLYNYFNKKMLPYNFSGISKFLNITNILKWS